MTRQELAGLSFEDLCARRWESGRAEYRLPDQPFVGDPLVELADELADAWLYAGVEMGFPDLDKEMRAVRQLLEGAYAIVRGRAVRHAG